MRQQGPPSPVQTTQSLLPQQPCFDGGLASLWGRPHARPGPSRTQMACARMASNSPLSMEVVTLVFLGPRTRVPRQKLRSALSTHQVMVTCPQLPPQSLLRPQKTPIYSLHFTSTRQPPRSHSSFSSLQFLKAKVMKRLLERIGCQHFQLRELQVSAGGTGSG